MEVDPMEAVENAREEDEDVAEKNESAASRDKRKSRLNSMVAVTIALLATLIGVAKVKDDNIVQAMQQAQAKSVDTWSWYQARKIRAQNAEIAADQFAAQMASATNPAARAALVKLVAKYRAQAAKQNLEMEDTKKQAEAYDKDYDTLNGHDDDFDLADALLAIAISMFAVTSLTQKQWLYYVALIPTTFGVVYAVFGLMNIHIGVGIFSKLLGS